MRTKPTLRLESLQLSKKALLEPVNFSIDAGECVCLSAGSGTGKTLLLRAIADMDEHAGKIYLNGQECNSFNGPDWRKRVGLLFAENPWWHEVAGDHFITDSENKTILLKWLPLIGLNESILSAPVNQCSTGERQRLALLRLLQNQPEVLLLDEPTSSMDPDTVNKVESFLASIRQQFNTAILWVSHDPHQIERIADRSLSLTHGKLVENPV